MALRTPHCPKLVAIADRGVFTGDAAWLAAIVSVAEAMVDYGSLGALQLRVKNVAAGDRERLASAARRAVGPAVGRGLRVVWNGTTQEAVEHGFGGVHWPQAMIPLRAPELPPNVSASASVHDRASAERAVAAGAHYVVFGPIFTPGSKEAPAVGLEPLRALVRDVEVPVLAVGGMTPERVPEALTAGVKGVAAVTGVLSVPRPDLAVKSFMQAIMHEVNQDEAVLRRN